MEVESGPHPSFNRSQRDAVSAPPAAVGPALALGIVFPEGGDFPFAADAFWPSLVATLVLLFPIFWGLGALSNPGLAASARSNPVVVSGEGFSHRPFASKPATEWGRPRNDLGRVRGVARPKDCDQWSGAQLYDAHCATCHQASGQGSFDGGLPPLFHNTAVGRSNTNNLVMVLLDGIERHGEGAHSGPEVKMQGFRKVMSDVQIATLATYLTKQYGNPDIKVSAEQVRSLRAGGEPSRLALLAQGGIAFGVLIVIALIMWLLRRGKKRA